MTRRGPVEQVLYDAVYAAVRDALLDAPQERARPSTVDAPAAPLSKPSGLLPVKEAAAYLACSPDHVYDLIAAGQLRAVNIGIRSTKTRIHAEDLDEYVERNTWPARA